MSDNRCYLHGVNHPCQQCKEQFPEQEKPAPAQPASREGAEAVAYLSSDSAADEDGGESWLTQISHAAWSVLNHDNDFDGKAEHEVGERAALEKAVARVFCRYQRQKSAQLVALRAQLAAKEQECERLLKACRVAVLALAHAAESSDVYQDSYKAVSDAISKSGAGHE